MLISGQPTCVMKSGPRICMYRARVPPIHVSAQHLELPSLRVGTNVAVGGHVEEWHAERANLIGQLGVIRDHHDHRHIQLAAPVPPEQVEQAVVLTGMP